MSHMQNLLIGLSLLLCCSYKVSAQTTNSVKLAIGIRSISSNTKDENRVIFSTKGGDIIVPVQNVFDAYAWTDNKERAQEVADIMTSCLPKEFLSIVKVEITSDFDSNKAEVDNWYPEGIINIGENSTAVPFLNLKAYLHDICLNKS